MHKFRFGIRTLLLVMLLSGLAVGSYIHFEYSRRWRDIQTTLAKFDSVEYYHETNLLYDELFAKARNVEIAKLMSIANDSVATQAAWEVVNRTIPEDSRKTGPAYHPKPSELRRFIDFFESRNRVKVPENWKAAVMDSRANRRDNIYPGKPKKHPYHRSEIDWIFCPANAKIMKTDAGLRYDTDDFSIAIPEGLIDCSQDGTFFGNVNCIKLKDLFF